MPHKESNAVTKRIPTKKEVREPTTKLLKAIAAAESEPIKSIDNILSTSNEVVSSPIFSDVKTKSPTGKAVVFDTILPQQI